MCSHKVTCIGMYDRSQTWMVVDSRWRVCSNLLGESGFSIVWPENIRWVGEIRLVIHQHMDYPTKPIRYPLLNPLSSHMGDEFVL